MMLEGVLPGQCTTTSPYFGKLFHASGRAGGTQAAWVSSVSAHSPQLTRQRHVCADAMLRMDDPLVAKFGRGFLYVILIHPSQFHMIPSVISAAWIWLMLYSSMVFSYNHASA
jgi:hypothetical protein